MSAVTPGTYDFRVVDAVEKVSKSDNVMIALTIAILVDGEEIGRALDHLVFTKTAGWKIDQFLHSIGQHPGEGVDHDIQCHDILGEEGSVEIGNEEGSKGGTFNTVVRYLAPGGF